MSGGSLADMKEGDVEVSRSLLALRFRDKMHTDAQSTWLIWLIRDWTRFAPLISNLFKFANRGPGPDPMKKISE